MSVAVVLGPRRAVERNFRRFHRGAHTPFAIRWFGVTALAGHLRHLLAEAAASKNFDLRDWMGSTSASALLDRTCQVLGACRSGDSLCERLGSAVWIDFVADTADDRDVSLAVGQMLFSEYLLPENESRFLPRGDILIFGGDTAYPVATVNELQRRLVDPWNSLLREQTGNGRSRVLLGIPGNHDWYDGLDGFGRLFRRNAAEDVTEANPAASEGSNFAFTHPSSNRVEGLLRRQLHLDELAESVHLAEEAVESLGALLTGSQARTASRLSLGGYTPVQDASYWAIPLAPGLDLWGVDRQLRTVDYRQQVFFSQRQDEAKPPRIFLVSPDPAFAYGEANEKGMRILAACDMSLDSDRLLYLTGDAHHYERLTVERSMHIISGGGGAFLHGTRIAKGVGSTPPAFVYPDRTTSLRLALGMPLRLGGGSAGFLPHILFALLAAAEILAHRVSTLTGWIVTSVIAILVTVGLTFTVRSRLTRPVPTWALSILFGIIVALVPFALSLALPDWLRSLGLVMLGNAFIGSFLLGLFLLILEITGLDHQHGFAALGHPGFRHFVRLCVHPDGKVEGFVIGKDDPLDDGLPVLIDRFTWE